MIHRTAVEAGVEFSAPENITFGYQPARNNFSVWFRAGHPATHRYIILGTGHEYDKPHDLLATVVLPDGFHTFHLCRIL